MSANEKLTNLKEKCNTNKIGVDRNFFTILDADFKLEEAYAFAQEIIDKADEAVTHGINNGFSIKSKNDIVDLCSLAVEASKVKKIVQLEKLEKERNIIMKGMKIGGKGTNIKEPIVAMLQNTIDGTTDILTVRGDNNGLYETVLNTLEKEKEMMKSVADSTSLPASVFEKEIFAQLLKLRLKIAKKTLTPSDFRTIANNIDKSISNWKEQNDAKAKKAKEGDYALFNSEVKDTFYIVTSTKEFLERYKVVEDLMADFKSDIEKEKEKNHEYLAVIAEKEKEKAAKIQKGQEIVALLKAGKTTEANAQKALAILKADKDRIDREINGLNVQRDGSARTVSSKESLLRNVESVLSKVDKDNPYLLYSFSNTMDLEALSSLFSGVPTNEDIKNVLHGLSVSIEMAQKQSAQIRIAAEQLDTNFTEIAEEVAEQVEQELSETVTEKASLEELIGEFQTELPSTEPQTQNESETLSVDDLLN